MQISPQKLLLLITAFISFQLYGSFDPRLTRDIIIDIDITLTTCCATLQNDFSGSFTTLAALESLVNNCTPVFITPALVGTTGFTINNPGVYKLSDNIAFNPVGAGAAITINASNVILDLQCFTIRQANLIANVNGIEVIANKQNILIINGAITSMTNNGIDISSGNSNIAIADMQLRSCLKGISLNGTSISPITVFGITGLELLANGTGASFTFAERGMINDCEVANNISAGFEFISSFSNTLDSCTISNTIAALGSSAGISAISGGNNIFQNCIIDGTNTSDTFTGNSAAGIVLGATENNDVIRNNEISNSTTTSNAQPFGIQMKYSSNNLLAPGNLPSFNSAAQGSISIWSPNNRYVAYSTIAGNNLSIFEFASNNLNRASFTTFIFVVNGLAWHPTGSYIATAEAGATTGLVNVFSFNNNILQPVTSFPTAVPLSSVDWSPDGRYIAIGTLDDTTNSLQVLRFTGSLLTIVTSVSVGDIVNEVNWSPDGRYIAIAILGGSTTVYRFANNTLTSVANLAIANNTVRWSPNGQNLCTGDASGNVTVYRFNGSSLTQVAQITFASPINQVDWSPDGQFVAVADTGTISARALQFNGNSLVQVATFNGRGVGGLDNYVDWSPAGNLIAIAGGNGVGNELRILSGLTFPSGSSIIKNQISNSNGRALSATQPGFSSGRGLSASSSNNLIIKNTGFDNDINYVFVTNIFDQFLANAPTRPSLISNLSFPPL